VAQVLAREGLSIPTSANSLSYGFTASIHTTEWGGENVNAVRRILKLKSKFEHSLYRVWQMRLPLQ
jgi:hypothetical protein